MESRLLISEESFRQLFLQNEEPQFLFRGGGVEVCVEDEGVGMAPEVLEGIKEPFFSTRLADGGLGLGVSICRSIVQKHKGTLKFESEDGKGTRAVVRLPGNDDTIRNGAGDLASKIPSGV